MAGVRFYNATDKLVRAFIIGKVEHGSSCSCALGNLCNGTHVWAMYHTCCNPEEKLAAIEMFNQLNYSATEIYNIEKHFEGREKSILESYSKNGLATHFSEMTLTNENDADGFKGLCNVFDYMISIEDWGEEEKGANIFQLLETANN